MASYDVQKKADRKRMRADRVAEQQAIRAGEWPRGDDDYMRWDPPHGFDPARWAGERCQNEIDYLDDVERRLSEGDPELAGWER
jgi:hypothetical protein